MGSGGNAARPRSYGVTVNKAALTKGIAAAPARNTRAASGLGNTRNGESRIAEPNAVEPPRAAQPQSKGPSGVDTGGAGTDPQSILARTQAARRRRQAQARGGGLSNVALGEATLG